jgi:L-iditol 2-dehydrogenase
MGVAQPANRRERAPTMRAHVLVRPGCLEFRDVPQPVPDADGIVVRVRAALTCGTDLKSFLRGHPKFPVPMLLGHEFAGDIAAVGAQVRGLREGDAIMMAPTAPCGMCFYCVRDQENLCPQVLETMVHGAYAEYVNVPGHVVTTNLYPKPPAVPYEHAALLEPLSCVVHAIAPLSLRPDDTVVLIGAGAFALLHLLLLRARRVGQIVVITRGTQRAALAQRLGADIVITGGVEHARDAVRDMTGGRGADVVIECTGQLEVWDLAPALVRCGGQAVLFGGCPRGSVMRVDTGRLHYDQVSILSPFHFPPRHVRSAYDLLAGGALDVGALISGSYRLEDLMEAFARLQHGDGAKFAIIP